ncbi:hypothetical protein TSUD_287760 [Trifolium subterraneum]|uniref:AAA+ ATPase At3g28540-like C-terminal domain-containing protein n=1 Tax=Trifolium subterraneum TaxID=3900 RepID=A0A2Z6P1P1_TRISU|nr:hypothetical protein TSUD_287760 [Trifolium subterraneum]
MIGEINMTPADVAENLMPKSIGEDFETCLKNFIQSLENAKKKAEKKVKKKVEDEETHLKVEENANEKLEDETLLKVGEKAKEKVEDEETPLKVEPDKVD